MPKKEEDCQAGAKPRRGRPVQIDADEREEIVLDCAIRLLSERGPDDVTMADIARCAGMSKRTLYTLYRSREELVGAGLDRISRTLFRPLNPDECSASLPERLRILLNFDLKLEDNSVPLEMLRIVIAETHNYPEMAKRLSKKGPGQVADLLRAELTRAAQDGEIALEAAKIPAAAELLVDMVVGNTIARLLDPGDNRIETQKHAARRDMAIDIFLNGVRPREY